MKPGDDVRWEEVPDGAMVFDDEADVAVRIRGFGSWVLGPLTPSVVKWRPDWEWNTAEFHPDERVRIIALGLTGAETRHDLHEMLRTTKIIPPARPS